MSFKHFICIVFFLFSLNAVSQTRKELEAQRKELQEQVNQIQRLLSQTRSVEKTELEELSELNLQINVQVKLIKAFNAESKALNKEIKSNEKKIKSLADELKALKKDYGEMIYKSYKSKSQNSRIMFLLSSANFHQAYKRLQYMKQYTDFRKAQGVQIGKKSDNLLVLNDTLNIRKKEKELLTKESKIAQKEIEKRKEEQQEVVAKVKKQEKKYISQIKKKQREERKINKKIDKIIRDAIAKSNKKTGKKSSKFVMTSEAKLLAKNFEGNKGRLPYPVKKGVVVRRFGTQKHPTIPGITVESAGVYILTEKDSNARAIFEGEVIEVQVTPGNKKMVLILHGNYITAYGNLENVSVKAGEKISIKQKIGKIYTDKISKKTILKFYIRKNLTRLNPASWVYRM
ncbi:MAG: peptidoglycan DD-metalloendopeptidase family protein [Flavobacteriaceae bacterium]|nr:peptidoglycan DD-metalloendopeptidase family protein [Flavobacteriaceae bacterium]